jgi:hypothetical protein
VSRLRRVRITRTPQAAAASFAGSALATFSDGLRKLVLADLQEGVVRVGDLPRLTRTLIWLGFVLLFAMVGMLFFNEFLRAAFPLLPITGGTTGRGELVPLALFPLTLFVLSVAWGFMLTGALHARLIVRLAVLLVYLGVAGEWLVGTSSSLFGASVAWAALLFVPVYFFVRRRAPASPTLEFGVLLVSISLTFGLSQIYAIQAWRFSGIPGVLATLPSMLITFSFLIIPLLLFIGLDIAEFVHRVASWTSGLTDAWTNRQMLYGALFLLLLWRLGSVVVQMADRVERSSPAQEAASYVGALGIPLAVGTVWWLVSRQGGEEVSVDRLVDVAKRAALPLIAAYMGLQYLNLVLVLLAGFLGLVLLALGFGKSETLSGALEFSSRLIAQEGNWQTLLAVVAILATLWFVRRGRRTLALYLGILGTNLLWIQMTNPGRPLSFFGWSGLEPVDFWWVVIFGAVTVFWLARGRLTEERARQLLLLVLITFLMRQTDFIEDPFSPFLGFTGVGLVALGLVWDALTIGFWANNDSRGLPRVSRNFLYLGYVLFSVAVVNWAVASHDLLSVSFLTGQAALGGFSVFGKPLIYAIFVVTLAQSATSGKDDRPTPTGLEERNFNS